MTNCFAYTRVSTAKQGEGVSLEAQREAIEAYALKQGFRITAWFEEKETAAKRGRPVFSNMVAQLRRGKAQGLIIHKIDRSARNFADWAKIHDLADVGIGIFVASDDLDFTSRGGRLTADIQAVIAADYIRNLRDETKKGMDGRLKQGLYPFSAPLGYLDQGGGKPKIPDPVKGPLVTKLFELYATGEVPIVRLVEEMATRGLVNKSGSPVSKTGIENILKNPFYAGLIYMKSTGQSYKGVHSPLISMQLFRTVQTVKAGKSGKKITKHNHQFQGLFQCGHCGLAMSPELQKGRVYYRCHTARCPTKGVREDQLSQAISAFFKTYSLTEADQLAVEQTINAWSTEASFEQEHGALLARIRKVEDREKALATKLIDGVIDDEMYREMKLKLAEDRLLQKQMLARFETIEEREQNLREFAELAKHLVQLYETSDRTKQRVMLKTLAPNRTVKGKSVEIQPCNWLLKDAHGVPALVGTPDLGTLRTLPTSDDLEDIPEWLQFVKEFEIEDRCLRPCKK